MVSAPNPVRKAREGEEDLRKYINRLFHRRLKGDWDSVIAVCGEEGVGKSTLALLIAWYIDQLFTVERNVIGSPDTKQIHEKLTNLPRYSAVIVDEAIKVMYKLGWQNRAQIMLNTVYSVCRAENKLSLLCMPKFGDFNSYFRQHRIKIWIQVVERGRALVFVRNPFADFVEDAWNMKENAKLITKMMRGRQYVEVDQEEYVEALKQTKNFAFEFTFNDVPEDIKAEYKTYKDKVRMELDIEDVKGITKLYRDSTKAAIRLLNTELGLTQQQLSEELTLSIYTINQLLKELGLRPSDQKKAKLNKPSNLKYSA